MTNATITTRMTRDGAPRAKLDSHAGQQALNMKSPSGRRSRSQGRSQRPTTTSRVNMRVAISLLPIFTILASLTFSSVKSSQAFVAACDKTSRYSPSHPSSNLNIGFIRTGSGTGTGTGTIDGCRYDYGLATRTSTSTSTSLLVAKAKSENPKSPSAGDNTDQSKLSSARPSHASPHQPRKQSIEYQKRKNNWANRYTSLQSLRETFGTNKNRFWGDLDAASARRLYKTLLPKALLELVQAGVKPEDLAPLAYQARVAAKLYARERCTLPARLMANLFDGFRSLKRYGRWQPVGMSYEQVWDKYQKAVLEDWDEEDGMDEDLTDEDIAIRSICMKILEASTRTNERVDRWTLPPDPTEREESEDLLRIAQTLENDVRKLLHPAPSKGDHPSALRGFKSVIRWISKLRRLVTGDSSKEGR